MTFSDRLQNKIESSNSCLVAGFDPRPATFPKFIWQQAHAKGNDNQTATYHAVFGFHELALKTIEKEIAAIKPNLAFFEQLGLAGMRAFSDICKLARELGLPVIADGKRGDIGSTAQAYSSCYLKPESDFKDFEVDALTVNPFLGFDTIEPFIEDCREAEKGIFVLVQTSNPGVKDIQNASLQSDGNISQHIAEWLNQKQELLAGKCGLSGLGAVVGATHPEQASQLRQIMPANFFLVPGLGSQGASSDDCVKSFREDKRGAIVNCSRGLMSSFSSLDINEDQFKSELETKVKSFNQQINSSLKS